MVFKKKYASVIRRQYNYQGTLFANEDINSSGVTSATLQIPSQV